ncbi:MAG: aldehyde ferredoxin oxidoreductase C-terminal domain-containing protein [Bacteroidales bacterium]
MCGHRGKFKGEEMQVPEYETTGMLGPNLGIFDPVLIARWNRMCSRMGFDTISAGSAIGWAMEATAKGLFDSDLKFGAADPVSEALNDIGSGSGKLGELGNGVKWLSEKYGGRNLQSM